MPCPSRPFPARHTTHRDNVPVCVCFDSEKFNATLFEEYLHGTYMAKLFMYQFGSAGYTALFRAMDRDGPRSIFQVAFHFRKNVRERWSRVDAYRVEAGRGINLCDSSENDSSRTVDSNNAKEQAQAAAEVENIDTSVKDKGAEQVCTL